ncbi:MAG: hypothetical protein OHK0017_06390 [Patescibacteria group bacterium]
MTSISRFLVLGLIISSLFVSVSAEAAPASKVKLTYRGYEYTNAKICDTDYSWEKYEDQFGIDMNDIKQGGANMIKIYYRPGMDKEALDRFMGIANRNGLKVMMIFWVNHGEDYSRRTGKNNRRQVINEYVEAVKKLKDSPAVEAIGFGSENNYFLGKTSKTEWFSLVNDATRAAKRTGAKQKFFTSNGEIADLVRFQRLMPSLDWFGATIYRPDRAAVLAINKQYSRVKKPLFITEFGKDSLTNGVEDEDGQTQILMELTTAFESLRNVVGVSVFQYEDGWHKAGNSCQHDSAAHAQLGGIASVADRLDNNMSEEWLGVTSQINSDQTASRPKKKAYYALQEYWRR